MSIKFEKYEIIEDKKGFCPDCNKNLKLLCPSGINHSPELPAFYICSCGFIGQVGVGRVDLTK